mgnify:CR=1 FL=1
MKITIWHYFYVALGIPNDLANYMLMIFDLGIFELYKVNKAQVPGYDRYLAYKQAQLDGILTTHNMTLPQLFRNVSLGWVIIVF